MRIHDIDTPALLIDAGRLQANLEKAQKYCDQHRIQLRPHIKTHKMPQISRMQIDLGAAGLTCAKLGEAEVMADAGILDLFVAYPICGDAKLRRMVDLSRRARLRVAFDTLDAARGISAAAAAAGLRIPCLIEVDTGVGRCGVDAEKGLLQLAGAVAELPGLELLGLMTYQGHVGACIDGSSTTMEVEGRRIAAAVEAMRGAGYPAEVVSGGTSPGLYCMHLAPAVTEARPGTYVFNDRNMVASGAAAWEDCALTVLVTVVSDAVAGGMIVDGGSKTFHSDTTRGGEGYGHFVDDPALIMRKMNEEHGYVDRTASKKSYRVGDRLQVIPNHVCVTVNMHDEAYLVRGDEVIDCWPVAARGRVR